VFCKYKKSCRLQRARDKQGIFNTYATRKKIEIFIIPGKLNELAEYQKLVFKVFVELFSIDLDQ